METEITTDFDSEIAAAQGEIEALKPRIAEALSAWLDASPSSSPSGEHCEPVVGVRRAPRVAEQHAERGAVRHPRGDPHRRAARPVRAAVVVQPAVAARHTGALGELEQPSASSTGIATAGRGG
jgi:hypothetical protein